MTEQRVYLRRRERRQLMRQAGLPWSAAAQYNNGERPLVRVVQRLIYWKGLAKYGEQGFYHIFGHCRRLFAEWAGRADLREGRTDHPFGHGQVCPDCRAGFSSGRAS